MHVPTFRKTKNKKKQYPLNDKSYNGISKIYCKNRGGSSSHQTVNIACRSIPFVDWWSVGQGGLRRITCLFSSGFGNKCVTHMIMASRVEGSLYCCCYNSSTVACNIFFWCFGIHSRLYCNSLGRITKWVIYLQLYDYHKAYNSLFTFGYMLPFWS